jgi:hypothetical protein
MIRLFGLAVLAAGLTGVARADSFVTTLSGPAEFPSNTSPGRGFAQVDFDLASHMMHVHVDFNSLTGTTTASHIHSPTAAPPPVGLGQTAGVATTTPTFTGFPLGVTSGSFDTTLDMTLASSYNPAFVAANGGTTASAEAALFAGISSGRAYLNIHSSTIGSGEIRGFLEPLPEPTSLCLLGVGTLGLLGYSFRRRQPQ